MRHGPLPSYLSMAKANPRSNRAPWYKNTAPAYAGIFLWFVFWSATPGGGANAAGGVLAQGIGPALLGLVVAALICHFLFYLAPGLFGMKTGLPLYVVGSSTYGTHGGLVMPGFLMGLLQFGWLGVNAYFASVALAPLFGGGIAAQRILAIIWAGLAAFVGLKGIQYVAKVATFLPLIPFVILLVMLAKTIGGIGNFDAAVLVTDAPEDAGPSLSVLGVIALSISYIVGFFATAGAAGVDFGTNSRDGKDVQLGGLVGITLAIIFAGGVSILIAAGGSGKLGLYGLNTTDPGFMEAVMGSEGAAKWMGLLLAVAAFPPACFSAFIAANSFKTTLPKVSPSVSIGTGAAVSALLAVTGWAGDLERVFGVIGASFGPVCGAMTVEYFLSHKQWSGPRKGWNMAGWISWVVGFVVGMLPLVSTVNIPAAPLMAFIVGAVLYLILAKMGLEPPVVPMPALEPTAESRLDEGPTAPQSQTVQDALDEGGKNDSN